MKQAGIYVNDKYCGLLTEDERVSTLPMTRNILRVRMQPR